MTLSCLAPVDIALNMMLLYPAISNNYQYRPAMALLQSPPFRKLYNVFEYKVQGRILSFCQDHEQGRRGTPTDDPADPV